jgi:hypothetical protein
MTKRLLTVHDLTAPRRRRTDLFELRSLERRIEDRIERLDARVDDLLALDGPPFEEAAAEIDVLCAAIGELRELLDEARREAALHASERRRRRSRPRRWV